MRSVIAAAPLAAGRESAELRQRLSEGFQLLLRQGLNASDRGPAQWPATISQIGL